MVGSDNPGSRHPVDQLILDIAQSGRQAGGTELAEIAHHVAAVGFPTTTTEAGARLAGIYWRGRLLELGSSLPYDVAHYLRHCRARQEWPLGTGLDDYVASISV